MKDYINTPEGQRKFEFANGIARTCGLIIKIPEEALDIPEMVKLMEKDGETSIWCMGDELPLWNGITVTKDDLVDGDKLEILMDIQLHPTNRPTEARDLWKSLYSLTKEEQDNLKLNLTRSAAIFIPEVGRFDFIYVVDDNNTFPNGYHVDSDGAYVSRESDISFCTFGEFKKMSQYEFARRLSEAIACYVLEDNADDEEFQLLSVERNEAFKTIGIGDAFSQSTLFEKIAEEAYEKAENPVKHITELFTEDFGKSTLLHIVDIFSPMNMAGPHANKASCYDFLYYCGYKKEGSLLLAIRGKVINGDNLGKEDVVAISAYEDYLCYKAIQTCDEHYLVRHDDKDLFVFLDPIFITNKSEGVCQDNREAFKNAFLENMNKKIFKHAIKNVQKILEDIIRGDEIAAFNYEFGKDITFCSISHPEIIEAMGMELLKTDEEYSIGYSSTKFLEAKSDPISMLQLLHKLPNATSGGEKVCSWDIEFAERELGFKFDKDYIALLRSYGTVMSDKVEILGLGSSNRLNVVNATQKARELDPDFPEGMYVIENLGIDGALMLQDANSHIGSVYLYTPGQKPIYKYNCLSKYIEAVLNTR